MTLKFRDKPVQVYVATDRNISLIIMTLWAAISLASVL